MIDTLSFLKSAQRARPHLAPELALFQQVRAIPYSCGVAHTAAEMLALGEGDCRAAAELLCLGLGELGIPAELVRYLYRLPELAPTVEVFPDPLDVHTVVQVYLPSGAVLLDASHDPALAGGSLIVGEWDGRLESRLCHAPISALWRVPKDDALAQATIERIFEKWDTRVAEAARRYTERFNGWLRQIRQAGAPRDGQS